MTKDELRNQLFAKYFEVEEGIEAKELMTKLKNIRETWKNLHALIEQNIKDFYNYDTLEQIKKIEHQKTNYLIIKFRFGNYIIIDLDTKAILDLNQMKANFDEQFFIEKFQERKVLNQNSLDYYHLESMENAQELIDFYTANDKNLVLPTKIYYQVQIKEAWSYFNINLANDRAQIGFQTPDQFLYEQLFLKGNLTPSCMQDAQSRIGKERMQEMFAKIPEIKIPVRYIPEQLIENLLQKKQAKDPQMTESKIFSRILKCTKDNNMKM